MNWYRYLHRFIAVASAMALLVAAVLPHLAIAQTERGRAGLRTTEQVESRAQRAAEELVSLSADTLIRLLRDEPGLLLQAKKALVRTAYEQGRLLDPQDLTDDALYDLIREDEAVRVLITREIEDRHYVQAKPRHEELERGLVLESRHSEKEVPQDNQVKQVLNQENAYWLQHERALEHYPEPQYPQVSPAAPSSQPPAYPPTQTTPESPAVRDPRRQIERAAAELPGSQFSDELPSDMTQVPRIRPEELPALLNASVSEKLSADMDKPRSSFGASTPFALHGFPPAGASSPTLADLAPTGREQPSQEARNETIPVRMTPPSSLQSFSRGSDQPMLRHRPNPYANVPSLYDLYSQYSGHAPTLERFGADVFRNGTGNFDQLPMDLPVGPEYVLGPGDGLSIELFGGISQRLQRVVDRTGRVALPEVGAIEVSGRNLGDVQHLVQGVLRTQFRDVQADVSLSRLRTVRVYVVGDVERPGAYDVSSLSTPLNAFYQAGGPTARGSLRILRHYRGNQLIQETDVYDLLLHGIRTGLQGLQPGDTLLVPPLGPQVTVEGMVRRPAMYELNGESSLAEVLELAGGVLQSGTLRHVDLERVEAHLSRSMLRLDIPENSNQDSVTSALEDFKVQDGDRIKISPILPYADKTVYLDGHVSRPGKFAFRDGMKITDIIKSYRDLLPEPYRRHAEIIRLMLPDYTPSVLAFNLDAALAGGPQDILLKPFDTIRVFGRFEFEDAPVITVSGEVRDPGDHVTNGATYLRDAVYLAGGTTPDAQLRDAQVFRRSEDGKLTVISVNLNQALEGDAKENILLQPKDRVFIHKSLTKVDPPSVRIEGEVARPGRYPLGEGMTATELVRVAGGLRRGAYTEAADLTRYEVERGANLTGEHLSVPIARALAGEPDSDVRLHDGDVLAIRQLPGWKDMGATITVKGEVVHPSAYGIKEGERLSSIIARAGGFRSDAYPYGAVFLRAQVRELEQRNRAQLLGQLQAEGTTLKGIHANDDDDKLVKDASLLQWKATVEKLQNTPPTGRLVIHISKDVKRWANTSADIEVRAGDVICIPKKAGAVAVDGSVYNPTAVAFKPGKSAGWYLRQAGGPTSTANKKAIFVVRADGSVVGGPGGMFTGGVETTQLFAGDTVVVPEKAFSGTSRWKSAFQVAQIVQAAAIAASVGRSF